VGRVYRKADGRRHTDMITQYFWPYKTRMNIRQDQLYSVFCLHCTMQLWISSVFFFFAHVYFGCLTAPISGAPTQRQSLNVDYSLSFLNNRHVKVGIFPLYGIRRFGNTGLIEGNGTWARTMAKASRHLNWMPVSAPIFFRNLNGIIKDITLRYS